MLNDMLKNEWKIRKLLGYKNFHLCTTSEGEWKLYRNYDDNDLYMAPENEPIMTNETHTEKELLKFAKKNREYNIPLSMGYVRVVFAIINVILALSNCYLNSKELRGLVWGINIVIIVECIIQSLLSDHNAKVWNKLVIEKMELIKKLGVKY